MIAVELFFRVRVDGAIAHRKVEVALDVDGVHARDLLVVRSVQCEKIEVASDGHLILFGIEPGAAGGAMLRAVERDQH